MSSDHSIKLAYSGAPLSDNDALNKIFAITQVCLVRCVKIYNGYKVIVARAEDLSPFLSVNGQASLKAGGFTPVSSPESKAKCTVLARKLDRTVLARAEEELRTEISRATRTDCIFICQLYLRRELRRLIYPIFT